MIFTHHMARLYSTNVRLPFLLLFCFSSHPSSSRFHSIPRIRNIPQHMLNQTKYYKFSMLLTRQQSSSTGAAHPIIPYCHGRASLVAHLSLIHLFVQCLVSVAVSFQKVRAVWHTTCKFIVYPACPRPEAPRHHRPKNTDRNTKQDFIQKKYNTKK